LAHYVRVISSRAAVIKSLMEEGLGKKGGIRERILKIKIKGEDNAD
jgi:hypothetical protein